ncbi:MAG: DUF4831 family protein [Prevotellaceae bacterium]|nr:DUF4831 family protein [Prevotellaceae bacterium]
MKKNMVLLAALLLPACIYAQTEVTAGVMRGKDYGVTYVLPQTQVEIAIETTKHTYTPGEFCKYAERYLYLKGLSATGETYWEINKIELRVAGVPDSEHVYFVKLKDKTVAPLMELTRDGIVRSINMPYSGGDATGPAEEAAAATVDPRGFLTEEILAASSRAKMAELVAKEIYSIRESRNALLRGEADNMPQDGAQLKIMLDNLNVQEQAMLEMFQGKRQDVPDTFTVRLAPEEMDHKLVFRFSKYAGLVDEDDLSGEPYYLSLVDLKTPAIPADDGKKKVDGVAYNVPGRARVTLTCNNKQVAQAELPVTQFGTVEYLAPVLFNKNSTTKVLFDTATGALVKVDREGY